MSWQYQMWQTIVETTRMPVLSDSGRDPCRRWLGGDVALANEVAGEQA